MQTVCGRTDMWPCTNTPEGRYSTRGRPTHRNVVPDTNRTEEIEYGKNRPRFTSAVFSQAARKSAQPYRLCHQHRKLQGAAAATVSKRTLLLRAELSYFLCKQAHPTQLREETSGGMS